MPTDKVLYDKFLEIEDNVFRKIIPRPHSCDGSPCKTDQAQERGYVCNPCGDAPNQGYLSRDAEYAILPPEESTQIYIDEFLSWESEDTVKNKFTIEAIKLNNLELQISAKIKELYDFQKIIISLNKIINNEINNLK